MGISIVNTDGAIRTLRRLYWRADPAWVHFTADGEDAAIRAVVLAVDDEAVVLRNEDGGAIVIPWIRDLTCLASCDGNGVAVEWTAVEA